MYKTLITLLYLLPLSAIANDDLVLRANEMVNATRIVCSGISDEISRVSNVSKAGTAVAAVGTVASTGALAAGIAKSQEEQEIEALIDEMCARGGCTVEGVSAMSNADFFEVVIKPMAQIAELQKRIEKSKKLGNWRTGLLAGTIGTNVANAILSGLNTDQSELMQQIDACNKMVKNVADMQLQLKAAGVNPFENPVMSQLDGINTWCAQINLSDIEKIEKRMKGVMGTSIAGSAIGVIGTATSAAANSDKYMDTTNKIRLADADKQKEHSLNATANVMAGANIVTGGVEVGLNVSLISLTKKLIQQAELCEDVLK